MQSDRTSAINILLEHNIRPSEQRIAVLKYLLDNRSHPTADEIYVALNKEMPTLSKTTVYNVVKQLADSGTVIALNIDEKNVRYDAHTEPHAHFRCTCCNRLYDVDIPDIQNHLPEKFEVTGTHVYYYGKCRECQDKERTGRN